MQEVESKFASFCCALARNSQLNVRSNMDIWALLATVTHTDRVLTYYKIEKINNT